MKIDHIAIYACDPESVRDFFVRFFGGTAGAPYHNPRTGLRSWFVGFGDGARLEIMGRPEVTPDPGGPMRSGYTHLSFSVGSREEVDALTRRLSEGGYATLDGPRTTGDGYYESSVRGPEGIAVEITE